MPNEKKKGINPQLDAAVRKFADWWSERNKKLDTTDKIRDPLFHYTDMRGLAGIIGTQTIWFTSILHLNDPSEMGHGLDMGIGVLEDEARRGDAIVKKFCELAVRCLVNAAGDVFGCYVASFSKVRNDLGQWRAYADNGRGVAIGLSPKLFEPEERENVDVREITFASSVAYDQKVCKERYREAIGRAVELLANQSANIQSNVECDDFLWEMVIQLIPPILRYTIGCKHVAYENEHETRLFLFNYIEKLAPVTEMRTRGSNLVPFIRSPLLVRSPGAITEILIGPAANYDLAADAVRTLLRSHGLPLDIVQKSGIPYTAH